jgi:hypothetical protein
MASGNFCLVLVERHRLDPRINESFRQRSQFRITATTAAHADYTPFAISHDASICRHTFHFRLTRRYVRYRPGLPHGQPHRFARSIQALPIETQVKNVRQIFLRADNPFRFKTRERRVVLMHALHSNAVRSGFG